MINCEFPLMLFYKFSLSKFTFMFIYNLEGGYECICLECLLCLGTLEYVLFVYIYINLSTIHVFFVY